MSEENHCRDCCCARSWDALGVSTYTGKSIPEHIGELRALLHEFVAMRGRAGFRIDDWERRVNGALFSANGDLK
jgi:hypothetical protein